MNCHALLFSGAARTLAFSLGLAALPLITGCSSMRVKLGMRQELAKIPVTTMDAELANNPGLAPGEKSPIVVQIQASNGKSYVTEGAGGGTVMWKDLVTTASGVSVNKKGVASLPSDPRQSEGQTGHVTITAPSHPGLSAELTIPIRYDYPYQASYSGFSGTNGTDGASGMNGTSGLPGSLDPTNPSPGGNGSDGTDGADGSNGGDGQDGPRIAVRLTMHPGGIPLVEAAVSAGNRKDSFYLIDPQGGSLTISSTGGSGGTGGKGGHGGKGGSGGIGTPNGSSGRDGLNGTDGRRGFDGRGGSITITYDPQVQPYLGVIRTYNPGGPKPTYSQQPVPPLW